MILPKTSGLKGRQETPVIEGREKKLITPDKLPTVSISMALTSLPTDSLHQSSEHTLHTTLRNILQQLPANPLPHHV